jgi:hypothetical protein
MVREKRFMALRAEGDLWGDQSIVCPALISP